MLISIIKKKALKGHNHMQLYANFELTASNYRCLAVNNLNMVEVFWRVFHPIISTWFFTTRHHQPSYSMDFIRETYKTRKQPLHLLLS